MPQRGKIDTYLVLLSVSDELMWFEVDTCDIRMDPYFFPQAETSVIVMNKLLIIDDTKTIIRVRKRPDLSIKILVRAFVEQDIYVFELDGIGVL